MLVEVRNGDIDTALKMLKRRLQKEGVLRELKLRARYVPPSDERRRKHKAAIARACKRSRKAAERDCAIPKAGRTV